MYIDRVLHFQRVEDIRGWWAIVSIPGLALTALDPLFICGVGAWRYQLVVGFDVPITDSKRMLNLGRWQLGDLAYSAFSWLAQGGYDQLHALQACNQ